MREVLYAIGALAEFLGILLVASPDLVPGAVRAAGWTRRRWRLIENRIRRALRLPGRSTTVSISAALSAAGALSVSAVVGSSAETVEGKVEFLLRRDRDTQQAVNDIRLRLEEIEQAAARGLDDLRNELRAHVAAAISESQADFRAARFAGTAALAIGLGLATAGNFVS